MGAADSKPKDERYCRTHALVATMFAQQAADPRRAAIWRAIAQSWSHIEKLKRRCAEANAEVARALKDLDTGKS